ncbi:unannotated protein [freshwater metagenome]|uniref:Unannotated protein n=1 Tax=freshwater metagenome TaxID=449393 RepID=A0A6J7SIY4_9ZZZZ
MEPEVFNKVLGAEFLKGSGFKRKLSNVSHHVDLGQGPRISVDIALQRFLTCTKIYSEHSPVSLSERF